MDGYSAKDRAREAKRVQGDCRLQTAAANSIPQ